MTAPRAVGDNHVQSQMLTAGEVSGYLPDAISRWPGIAKNDIFNDRNAIQDLISNGQKRIDKNAKFFGLQMTAKYAQSSHKENFLNEKYKKDFLKQKAKNNRYSSKNLTGGMKLYLGRTV